MGRGRLLGRLVVDFLLGGGGIELPRCALQFPTQNPYVAGGLKGQCDTISSNASDFDRDLISDVNPFS
jgi:hypothetical protein